MFYAIEMADDDKVAPLWVNNNYGIKSHGYSAGGGHSTRSAGGLNY